MYRYSRDVNVEFYLDRYFSAQDLYNAVDRIAHANAETNTAGGIDMMRDEVFSRNRGDRENVPNIGGYGVEYHFSSNLHLDTQ